MICVVLNVQVFGAMKHLYLNSKFVKTNDKNITTQGTNEQTLLLCASSQRRKEKRQIYQQMQYQETSKRKIYLIPVTIVK